MAVSGHGCPGERSGGRLLPHPNQRTPQGKVAAANSGDEPTYAAQQIWKGSNFPMRSTSDLRRLGAPGGLMGEWRNGENCPVRVRLLSTCPTFPRSSAPSEARDAPPGYASRQLTIRRFKRC
jgi:hypothetical protein